MVRDLVPGPAGEPVRDAILEWDGVMAAGSRGAAAFAAWRSALTTPARAPSRPSRRCATPRSTARCSRRTCRWRPASGWGLEPLANAGTPFGIDVRRLATEALEDAAGHPDAWGDTHVLGPTHAFDVADADLDATRRCRPRRCPATSTRSAATGWLPGITDEAYRGSVARYVWDLADRARSGWVVPMGASGDPRSPHHLDQLEAWAEARLLPVELDWDRLKPDGEPTR